MGYISISKALITFSLGYLTYLSYNYVQLLRKLRQLNPLGNSYASLLLCPALPTSRAIPFVHEKVALGGEWTFTFAKRNVYEKLGWNAFITAPLFPAWSLCTYVGDVDAIKQITNDRVKFPKPLKDLKVLNAYGLSVLTTDGDEWKKHRRISQPAFTERNIRLVWKASRSIVEELIDELWENKPEVEVAHTLDVTVQMALMVLSIAAFGKPMSWKTEYSSSGTVNTAAGLTKGHKMPFARTLYIVSSNLLGALIAPSWSLIFTKKLREIRRAFWELQVYMDEIITERKEEYERDPESVSSRGDLLANLIAAAAEDQDEENAREGNGMKKKGLSLSQSELRGNIFIYLIAGHETTAHTFTYLLALLALYPEEQDKLFKQTQEVLGDRQASYEDFPQLTRALAVFYESLRMFPPVTIVPKKATELTSLRVSSTDGKDTRDLVLPKDTRVFIHTMRVHHDQARYYPDPERFNPDRFMGNDWNRDAFLPFSVGARACIGRKFAEVEIVSMLTALISRYSIHLTDKMKDEFKELNLSTAEKTERLLKSKVLITTTPISVPLVFRGRA